MIKSLGFSKKNVEEELELLEYFENKIKKMDSNTKNKLFGILKNDQLKQIEHINYAIQTIKTNYSIERKNIDKLYAIKENIHKYLENAKKQYLDKLEKDVNPELQCQICYENRLDIVLNPCGHMFCHNCFKDSSNCFVCRKDVTNIIKVFKS
jgi:hypothetical protein